MDKKIDGYYVIDPSLMGDIFKALKKGHSGLATTLDIHEIQCGREKKNALQAEVAASYKRRIKEVGRVIEVLSNEYGLEGE